MLQQTYNGRIYNILISRTYIDIRKCSSYYVAWKNKEETNINKIHTNL